MHNCPCRRAHLGRGGQRGGGGQAEVEAGHAAEFDELATELLEAGSAALGVAVAGMAAVAAVAAVVALLALVMLLSFSAGFAWNAGLSMGHAGPDATQLVEY